MQEALKISQLEETQLKTCINSSDIHAKIAADIQEGNALNVSGTPTVYINKKKLTRLSPEVYYHIIKTQTR